MISIDKLEKANKREAKAADRARKAIEDQRKATIARKAREDEIRNARAFRIGRTILDADLSPEELRVLSAVLDRGVKDDKSRELVSQFLSKPKAGPNYDELRQAGK